MGSEKDLCDRELIVVVVLFFVFIVVCFLKKVEAGERGRAHCTTHVFGGQGLGRDVEGREACISRTQTLVSCDCL